MITPAYTYELAAVRHAYARLRTALPEPHVLYYSLKANPHPDVARQLALLGCRAEVSSSGELAAALAAGFAPADVLFTGPGKSSVEVRGALTVGVRRFSVESPTDLARVVEACGQAGGSADCLLRINPDQPVPGLGLAMTGTASQFGSDLSWLLDQPHRFAGRGGARVVGLHLYMGTNVAGEDALYQQYEQTVGIARTVADAAGFPLTEVDLGGGFAAPYAAPGELPEYPTLGARLRQLFDTQLPNWRDGHPVVSFESGRYLVGTCGTLRAQVLDVKRSKGRTFAVLDSGIHHLGGMSGLRRLPRLRPRPHVAATGDPVPHTLTGPLCTPLDVWAQDLALPPLQPGDVIEIPNVGAYGLSASLLAFLSHPAPVEIVLDEGRPVSISRLSLTRDTVAAATVAA